MEWLNGPGNDDMEVDIGYMPQMELRSSRRSQPAVIGDFDYRLVGFKTYFVMQY